MLELKQDILDWIDWHANEYARIISRISEDYYDEQNPSDLTIEQIAELNATLSAAWSRAVTEAVSRTIDIR